MQKKVASKKSTALAVVDDKSMEALREFYPVETGYQAILLPRLSFVSQDKTEESGTGKNKKITVVTAAGTFFTERQGENEVENAEGKMVKEWLKEEIGESIEGIILYNRKQLKYYDQKTEEFTSSPVYDTEDEVIPLWKDKVEVARGTPKELKAKYQYTDAEGKVKTRLEENRILYILYEGEVHQLNLRGSSMFSFLTWSKKLMPPAYLTEMSSEPMQKGDIAWNKMTFTVVRPLTKKEMEDVIAKGKEIKTGIAIQKAAFASNTAEVIKADKKFNDF